MTKAPETLLMKNGRSFRCFLFSHNMWEDETSLKILEKVFIETDFYSAFSNKYVLNSGKAAPPAKWGARALLRRGNHRPRNHLRLYRFCGQWLCV